MTYNFRCANGDIVSTEANTESEARAKTMEYRWGPPCGMYAPFYRGRGLTLVDDRGLPK